MDTAPVAISLKTVRALSTTTHRLSPESWQFSGQMSNDHLLNGQVQSKLAFIRSRLQRLQALRE